MRKGILLADGAVRRQGPLAAFVRASARALLCAQALLCALATAAPVALASEAAWTRTVFELQRPEALSAPLISLWKPVQAPAAHGYPVIFMLDGNAVDTALDAATPGFPVGTEVPAIVTLGYVGAERFDIPARTADYTPPRPDGGEESDPLHPERKTGGADRFLDFITQTLIPELARRIPIDPERLGIWGHSFGGLLVLHARQTRPGLFRCHIAASPSLWWRDGSHSALFSQATHPPRAFDLLLTRGSAEAPPPPPAGADARSHERWRVRALAPQEALPRLAERLQTLPGARVTTLEFPGLSHGQAFGASIAPALHWFSQCAALIND